MLEYYQQLLFVVTQPSLKKEIATNYWKRLINISQFTSPSKMFSIYKLKHLTHFVPSPRQTSCLHLGKPLIKFWTISIWRCMSDTSESEKQALPEINLDSEYKEISRQYLNPHIAGHGALVIQPHIKYGPNKRRNTTSTLQLQVEMRRYHMIRYMMSISTVPKRENVSQKDY